MKTPPPIHQERSPLLKTLALLHGESAPRKQAERTDREITEVSAELRSKLVRLDQKIGAALDTVEVTGSRIRHAVLAPVRSVKALSTGIQTGINTYRERSRQSDEWIDMAEERIRYHSVAEASGSRRPFSN